MDTIHIGKEISTVRGIAQIGLPARQTRKAVEALALAEALISPFFGPREIKANAKKAPAIRPVLKAAQ